MRCRHPLPVEGEPGTRSVRRQGQGNASLWTPSSPTHPEPWPTRLGVRNPSDYPVSPALPPSLARRQRGRASGRLAPRPSSRTHVAPPSAARRVPGLPWPSLLSGRAPGTRFSADAGRPRGRNSPGPPPHPVRKPWVVGGRGAGPRKQCQRRPARRRGNAPRC